MLISVIGNPLKVGILLSRVTYVKYTVHGGFEFSEGNSAKWISDVEIEILGAKIREL
jgi:hypothetical protein